MEICAMCGATATQDEGDPCVVQLGRVWPVCGVVCGLESRESRASARHHHDRPQRPAVAGARLDR